ncbi:MAG TPA: type VI secretion system lipoprotein TssJ [Aromatoleum sp.]|uniref:type VI secretion system lipoprotein TssJ n=1 Tax=Aromatoleum sp. TaxID=2307007 RepID=UPI002B46EC89|nr:type VI secretion system lipoprotein TssJ [Aromatoleum sp.]HJV27452.1 type VI secretion system lipoprotein TssJ [Aromatoleum sp.]
MFFSENTNEISERSRRRGSGQQRPVAAFAVLAVLLLSGCAGTTAAKVAGTAVSFALESAGLGEMKDEHREEASYQVPLRIQAAEQLNLSADGKPLSLVVKIYQLSGTEAFSRMTYAQANIADEERALLADQLVSSREVVLIPGRTYELPQTLSPRATAIGIVGQFRAPSAGRWKLAFDARASKDNGIAVGALACALATGAGIVINQAPAESARSAAGSRCNA